MTLSATDRLELSDLVHRYAAFVDARRLDDVAALFTTSAELMLPNPPKALGPSVRHHGTAGVRAALGSLGGVVRTHHAIVGEVYTTAAAGTAASGSIAGVAHHWIDNGERITDVVWYLHYADEYRRTDGGWRFARRALDIDAIENRSARQVRN